MLFAGIIPFCFSQPQPCGANPTMAPSCTEACVICDIDGFTGTNNLQSNDNAFGGFCSYPDNVHYVAFIAGSSSLSIRIDLSNCNNGFSALDLGFYESLDCENYTAITNCYDDLLNGEFAIFDATNLNIGQYYYLVMDGSAGAVCDWTFTVLSGSTEVSDLDQSESPQVPILICEDQEFSVSINPQVGASFFSWFLDGSLISNSLQFNYTISEAGDYNLCFQEANPCDEAELSCRIITVQPRIQHDTTIIICEGDSILYNGLTYLSSGIYPDILIPDDSGLGCDTIAQLNLDFGTVFEGDDDYFICDGDTLNLNGQQHFETGIYDHFLLTDKGCDSIVHVFFTAVICNMEGISDSQDLLCYGDGATGAFTFQITSGTPPFNYSWVKIFEEDEYFGSGTLSSDFEDITVSNVPAGSYLITVDDGFGNFTIISAEVVEPAVIESTLTSTDYNGFNVSCFEGADASISSEVSGGTPPYQYSWSDGSINSPIIVDLPSDSYIVTITDANNCQHIDSIVLTEPTQITFTTQVSDPNCDGPDTGTINILSPTGGIEPYLFSFNGSSFNQTTEYTDLEENKYLSVVSDRNGCEVQIEDELIAAEIPEVGFQDDVTINLGDSIWLTPTINDISIGQVAWTDNQYISCSSCTDTYAFPINTSQFNIEVTSMDGCIDDANISIRVLKDRDIYAPNIFSPSSLARENQRFSVLGGRQITTILTLTIFDRWGNIVFKESNLDKTTTAKGWDGTVDGAIAETAVYVWVAEVEYLDFHVERHIGDIMLVN